MFWEYAFVKKICGRMLQKLRGKRINVKIKKRPRSCRVYVIALHFI